MRPSGAFQTASSSNAQNKQTVKTIIQPLRELGIPVAGIVDIDILKEGGVVWASFLESAGVPEIDRQALCSTRALLKQKFDSAGKEMKRDGGIGALNDGEQEAARNLLERLAEYGLFVVPHGELEAWVPQLGCRGRKSDWLIGVFEAMGEDPTSPDYVRPTADDVWEFIGQVKSWLTDPRRKGIPF